MTGQNIVCFAKDWTEDPTSNNHVMRLLAESNRVLWVNSIATRRPDFTSRGDLTKIARKLRAFVAGPARITDTLWVFTPVVLPFPHSALAAGLNERILRLSLRWLRRRLHMDPFQLWTFLPTAVRVAGKLDESVLVYYCTDEWSQFEAVDGMRIAAMERELCRRADVVFCTSHALVETKRAFNPETHLARHGVDHRSFARALDPTTTVPADVAALPHPIIGFFGLIEHWIDTPLIEAIAAQRPHWSIVLIGGAKVDVAPLKRFPNVHLLGRRPYAELPRYCRAFDVALCPFVQNELTRHVNPIKLREYLSAGLPVVSTPLPEVMRYADTCYIATEPPAFVAACERAVAEDSPERRRARSDAMRTETWEHTLRDVCSHVLRVRATRSGRSSS